MAKYYEKFVDIQDKRQLHKMRPSYLSEAKHINDRYINLGYDYLGNILKNGSSPELWANPQQNPLYGRLEGMITYALESTKMIKKWFSIAHDKNTTALT